MSMKSPDFSGVADIRRPRERALPELPWPCSGVSLPQCARPSTRDAERMQNFQTFDGALLVDKPAGPTSHDVVAAIRRKFQIEKVGHCGTLDPNATGLL